MVNIRQLIDIGTPWAKGFPFKPSLERLSIGEHGSSVGFKSVTLKSMDYQPNKRLDEDK